MVSHVKIYCFGLLLLLSSCQRCQIKKDQESVQGKYAGALAYAQKNLPLEGKLVQQADGYAYIKVDDRYIHELFPLLQAADEGFKKPPYFRRSDAPGAHISVFYENEHVKAQEAGTSFAFTLNDIKAIDVNKYESYIILQVSAPELEKLRKHYGLSPKLKGHEFHISIAKRSKGREAGDK